MANIFNRFILEEGWRNVRVMVTGFLDTSDASVEPFIGLDELTNNDPVSGRLVGLRIDSVQYSMSAGTGLEVQLKWEVGPNGGGDQLITALAGQGHDKYKKSGGLIPPLTMQGFTGGIHLYTSGFAKSAPPTGFTVTLGLVKLYR
jgi:hypothetical protein